MHNAAFRAARGTRCTCHSSPSADDFLTFDAHCIKGELTIPYKVALFET